MSKITATSKMGFQITVCILDEEFPGCAPLDVGKAFLSQDSTGRRIDDDYWIDWRVEPDNPEGDYAD